MGNSNAKTALNYLQSLEEEVDFLLTNGSPDSDRKIPADDLKNRLKILKNKIRDDAKSVYRAYKDDDLTSIENAFLEPALRQASANFTIRSNTPPYTDKWTNGLYDLLVELSYHRSGLMRFLKEAGEP